MNFPKDNKIFIIDGDLNFSKQLKNHIRIYKNISYYIFKNSNELIRNLSLEPDLILLGEGYNDIAGPELFMTLKNIDPSLRIVIISNETRMPVILDYIKLGACDFIVRDDKVMYNVRKLVMELYRPEKPRSAMK